MDEKKENTSIKKFLDNITTFFGKKKKIDRIYVTSATRSFWVSNPKKIKFWKDLAETQGKTLLFKNDAIRPTVTITKVIYKGETK